MFSFGWYPGSKKESSKSAYYTARVASVVFVGLWAAWVVMNVWGMLQEEAATGALPTFITAFIIMTTMIFGFSYLAYRYVAHLRITPNGLGIHKGKETRLQPWQTIAGIHLVPFVQPGCWQLRFNDGSPAVCFFAGGSHWVIFGYVLKARSDFVEELKKRMAAAAAPEEERGTAS